MKRIVNILGIISAVIVFFTGCNSLSGSMEVKVQEIQQSVAESESINTTEPQGIKDRMPDYFEQNMQEKFQNEDAPRAFQIKDGHSQNTNDIEAFQVAALLPDKTFIYGYSTRIEGEEKPRDMVHCVAFYNYESEEFNAFHEKTFSREWETEDEEATKGAEDKEEAFTIQVCDTAAGEQEIFIYDNGEGYIYRMDGTVRLHVNILGFVQRQYPYVHSVSVVHAVTDGDNRIYLELSIEKEALNVDTDVEGASENSSDSKDTEEEMEELDEELSRKLDNVVLVYDMHSLNYPLFYQNNENYNAQINAWKAKADGKEYSRGSEPNAQEDWTEVIQSLPDKWGGAYIIISNPISVYEWKGNPAFLYNNGVCTFIPDPNAYTSFTNIDENVELWNQFISYGGHYSGLYGRFMRPYYHSYETYSRTFTVSWEETETNDAGEEVTTTKTEEKTQKISLNTRVKYAYLMNAYYESYWVLDKSKATSLGNAIGNDILCSNDDRDAYWIRKGGKLEKIGSFEENQQFQVIRDGDSALLLNYDMEKMQIQSDKLHTKSGAPNNIDETIDFQKLSGMAQPGNSVYDLSFQTKNEEQITGNFNGYGGVYITGDQIVRTKLSLDQDVVDQLLDFGENVFMPSKEGYLITIEDKGLVYYDPTEEKSMVLLTGSWYGTWKTEDGMVSIGFSGNASYGQMDIASSRVYEYKLDKMVSEAMEDTLNAHLEQKQKEQESELAKAQEDLTRESTDPAETVEDMAERWNRDHPQEEREQAASQALEDIHKSDEE